jgi:hypothetical protein
MHDNMNVKCSLVGYFKESPYIRGCLKTQWFAGVCGLEEIKGLLLSWTGES